MSKRVLCKYFAHGACLKGEYCEFSHDWKDQANNVCTFYQRGACSYGSRCRYEHVKVNQPVKEPTVLPSIRIPAEPKSKSLVIDEIILPDSIPGASSTEDFSPVVNTSSDPWKEGSGYGIESETVSMLHSSVSQASDHPICAYAASGTCSQGDNCPQLHGDLCSTCGKHCLHPFRPEEREEHIKQCQHNHKRLEALRYSQEIECCVCLERVLSKAKPSERKFGILSECDHAFCVACIRSWRANTPSSGMDVNATLRSCPICRKVSHFVIPSVIWYSNPEEKHEIVTNYKKKLSTIDCKYFDFGNSKCPFSTSCFYKHAYKDGRLEEVKLRHLGAADGSTVIAKEVRLSEFLATLHI